ncbi:MAG: exported protein of unknown function [Solirubrobacterales bacterium]|nr:exported protein of unknown function [Solirubrobacterales bacterium]
MHHARRAALVAVVLSAGVTTSAASADVRGWDFEPGLFSPGSINGQQGWTKEPTIEGDVVTNSGANQAAFGLQSLRLTNNVTTGGFGGPSTPGLVDGAGETTSSTHGVAGGVRQPNLETSFSFRSQSGNYSAGLRITASPDNGAASRNGFVAIEDRPAGLAVVFIDVPSPATTGGHVDFVDRDVATGLSRAATHTVRISTQFVEGPNNDIARVYVDGALAGTGTTWENYYRNDTEQAFNGNTVPVIDQLLFRMNQQAPVASTDGILVDDVRLESFGGPSGPVGPVGSTGLTGATGSTGAPGAGTVGPAGATTSGASTGDFAGVRLTKLRLSRRSIDFTVSCPASAGICDGRVRAFTSSFALIASRNFLLSGGRSRTVKVKLSRAAQARLAGVRDYVQFRAFARDRTGHAASTGRRATVRP